MPRLEFTKMVGSGNDFIIIDNRRKIVQNESEAARILSDRKASIGADGLLLVERSKIADIRMRILNPDGSEAEMCGNGIRCIAKFASERRVTRKKIFIETLAGVIGAEVRGDVVKAKMIEPKDIQLHLPLHLGGKIETVHFINTGVPHVVKIVSSLDRVDIRAAGREIRYHRDFAPRGTNANFIEIRGNVRVRTYERGVEDETLSCGTGSTASALIAAAVKNLRSPVKVTTRGGETLTVYFKREGGRFREVYLEGKVKKSFQGRVEL